MRTPAQHLLAALHAREGRNDRLLRELTEPEWHAVADLGLRQRVGSLLCSRPCLPMPVAVREKLIGHARHATYRILTLSAAFKRLSGAAAVRGLDVIALKGLHMAAAIYPQANHREMSDIDILVSKQHLQAVADLAQADGYSFAPLTGVSHHHLPPLVKGQVRLEIHWQLFDDGHGTVTDPAGLLERAVALPRFPGAKGLCSEDLLLHVCLHAASHHVLEMGVRSLCDVRAIISAAGERLDWKTVVHRSREWGGERSVALLLVLARTHLGARVPDEVLADLRDAIPDPALVDAASDFLMEDAAQLLGTSEAARELLTIGDTRQRIRHIATHVVRPFSTRPDTVRPGRGPRLGRIAAVTSRVYGLVRRHGGWLWRAARRPDSPLRDALDKRNALARWIREG